MPKHKLVHRSIGMTDALWERVEQIKQLERLGDTSEAVRSCIAAGYLQKMEALAKEIELDNKRLVNQKLKQRQGAMQQRIEAIAEKLPDDPDVQALLGYLKD